MSVKLDDALALARAGFRIFPVARNSKTPLIEDWPDRATRDEATIVAWWGEFGDGINAGWTTGGGHFAVDLDVKGKHDGIANWLQLNEHHGAHDKTPTSLTPSGGRHLLFACGIPLKNSSGKLAKGIDTRGERGFILLPPSTIDGVPYRWATKLPSTSDFAKLPPWAVELCERHVEREATSNTPAVAHLDADISVGQAITFLLSAEPAVEGDTGDFDTLRTAMRVRDLGVSKERCLELMLDHWNDRCSPPWKADELETKVENGYRYGRNQLGAASPAIFAEHPLPRPKGTLNFAPLVPFDVAALPARDWQIHGMIARRFLGMLVAPPGAGKSIFSLLEALALVTGREDILGMKLPKRQRVIVYNHEDDLHEMQRRWAALMIHYSVTWDDLRIEGVIAITLISGVDQPFSIAKRGGADNSKVLADGRDEIIDEIRHRQADVVIFDPLAELHALDENNNVEMVQVMVMFREIAQKANVGLQIIHHTRKLPSGSSEGHAGNLDSGRGAGGVGGVARMVHTLYTLSQKDAKRWGVAEEERHQFVRLDSAKGNLTASEGRPRMFRKHSVVLNQGRGNEESVGVLAPVTLTIDTDEESEMDLLRDIVAVMEGKKHAFLRAVTTDMLERFPMYEEVALGRRIRTLLDRGPREIDGWRVSLKKKTANPQAKRLVICEKIEETAEIAAEDILE